MKTTDFNAKLAAITPANPALAFTSHGTVDNSLNTAIDVPEERVIELNDELNKLRITLGFNLGGASSASIMSMCSYIARTPQELCYMAYNTALRMMQDNPNSSFGEDIEGSDIARKVAKAKATGQDITSDEFIDSLDFPKEVDGSLKDLRDKMFGKRGSK